MKKSIISINGFPGSGKSSTANGVAKALDYKRFSSGDFMRNAAISKGVSLNAFSSMAEKDPSIDYMIDAEVKRAGTMENLVIDSRLAFHWIPESFKVYLVLPSEIAKERVLNNLKENELRKRSEYAPTRDEVYQKITERLASEKKRYKELYNIDHTDKNNYDLVVDTNTNTLEEVIQLVVKEYKKWQQLEN
ncbi:MAG: cytidylate kinase family protein [Candidatus Pacebacteria bacterium]|jgi:cytidylate kinase|nr:cytidylate kinase family protein [Candidatus Paceibacterota bacterium]